MKRWSDEKTNKLVELYGHNECLWNTSSSLYKNRLARENAYKFIIDCLGGNSVTIKDLKLKIKGIRSTYHQEIKKMKYGGGVAYEPTIPWFAEMHKIMGEAGVKMETASTSSLNESQDKNKYSHSSKADPLSTFSSMEAAEDDSFSRDSSSSPFLKETSKPPAKKRRLHGEAMVLDKLDTLIATKRNDVRDEFYYFGMSVAAQLRQMPLKTALKQQFLMNKLLLEARETIDSSK